MKKKFGLGCLTIVLIGVIAAGIFVYRQHAYRNRVIAEARAMSVPTNPDELAAAYPIPPDDQNAAPLYREAIALSTATEAKRPPEHRWDYDGLPIVGEGELPNPGAAWSEKSLALANAYLAENAEAINATYAANAREGCQFYADFSKGFQTDMEHLAGMRSLARNLALQARVAVRDGRPDDAMRALTGLARIGDHLANEPFLIGQLVRCAVWGLGTSAAQDVAMTGKLDDAQLQTLATVFNGIETTEAIPTGLTGEFVSTMSNNNIVDAALESGQSPMAQEFPLLFSIASRVGGLFGAGMYANVGEWDLKLIEAFRVPFPEALDNADAFDAEFGQGHNVGNLAKILVPALTRVGDAQARPLAQARVITALCAIQRYRLAEGKAPYSLDALVPTYLDAIPNDPHDGKDIRYLALPDNKGFILYAVGANRIDDRGELDPKLRSGDIGVEIAP